MLRNPVRYSSQATDGPTGLTRVEVKRARDALVAQGQHASIDAISIALGNTGSKTTIPRHLKAGNNQLAGRGACARTRVAGINVGGTDEACRASRRLPVAAR
ncbi:DNA-binding protein [Paraburkholderia sp. PGU19]|uniref:DNA-binding protein n=1 Tax=Paraburkholderia sp. PGU19 TaxID=2735434 RepID=UPI00237B5438|nr:DNA-binding protein [Paraburkholderia sp. PGU19]